MSWQSPLSWRFHSTDEPIDNVKPVIALAGSMGVHLNLIVFGVLVPIPTATYPGIPDMLTADEFRHKAELAEQRAKTLEVLVGDANVSATIMVECIDRGMIGRTMSRHALCADISVFPHGGIPQNDLATDAFNGVLFDAARPVVVLGAGDRALPELKTALMAWNHEPEAAVAIHDSLSLLDDTVDIHIVQVHHEGEAARKPADPEMQRFLERHGKKVTMHDLQGPPGDVADLLLRQANQVGADIIVMGAYGHSRLRQWLLGGTTRDLLSKTEIPVFMAH